MHRRNKRYKRYAKLMMPVGDEGDEAFVAWLWLLCEVVVMRDLVGFGEALAPDGEFGGRSFPIFTC